MPDFLIQVFFEYPVSAINAVDAFSTLPVAIKVKYINGVVHGKAEVIDKKKNLTVLKAVWNPETAKGRNPEYERG